MKSQGAQFEISVDGKSRSHLDRRETAMEAEPPPLDKSDWKVGGDE